jgi:hypothetical protein
MAHYVRYLRHPEERVRGLSMQQRTMKRRKIGLLKDQPKAIIKEGQQWI